jgi:hypothetical protein
MPSLQVKNVPAELYAAVRHRAADEGVTLSEFVLATLSRELERPSLQAWVADARTARSGQDPMPLDMTSLMDSVKDVDDS